METLKCIAHTFPANYIPAYVWANVCVEQNVRMCFILLGRCRSGVSISLLYCINIRHAGATFHVLFYHFGKVILIAVSLASRRRTHSIQKYGNERTDLILVQLMRTVQSFSGEIQRVVLLAGAYIIIIFRFNRRKVRFAKQFSIRTFRRRHRHRLLIDYVTDDE